MLPQDENRQHDLYFGFPASRIFNLSYELPAGFAYEGEPVNTLEGGTAGLRYQSAVNLDPETGLLVYQRSDSRDYSFYAASSYTAMRSYFNLLAKHDAEEIVLRRKP